VVADDISQTIRPGSQQQQQQQTVFLRVVYKPHEMHKQTVQTKDSLSTACAGQSSGSMSN